MCNSRRYIEFNEYNNQMKRIAYTKPTTEVVKLQQTQMLMTSGDSSVGAERSSYGTAITDDWD
jgi:hypothetical protein